MVIMNDETSEDSSIKSSISFPPIIKRSLFLDIAETLDQNDFLTGQSDLPVPGPPDIEPTTPAPGPAPAPEPEQARSFDPASILHGPVVFACKEVWYQGHACPTSSVAQATDLIEHIGIDSIYAMRLVEAGELLALSEDNGHFMCGAIVAQALKRLDGFNALLCVTRHVKGCFVTDMIHAQQRSAVKQAAEKAADLLLDLLKASNRTTNTQR